MSLDHLDPLLSTPKKLAAIGMLANVHKVEFAFMRDHLKLSDSDLSKQMRALVDAGYVKSSKTGRGQERQTWFRISRQGEKVLTAHLHALNALVLAELPPPAEPASSEELDAGVESGTKLTDKLADALGAIASEHAADNGGADDGAIGYL